MNNNANRFIDPHGGFRDLKSYQMAQIVYDATVAFCDRRVNRRSRTHDQMVQAARSGKQNIAEGSMASGTSKKTERTPMLQKSEGFRDKASMVKL
jgi:hypothetical protein